MQFLRNLTIINWRIFVGGSSVAFQFKSREVKMLRNPIPSLVAPTTKIIFSNLFNHFAIIAGIFITVLEMCIDDLLTSSCKWVVPFLWSFKESIILDRPVICEKWSVWCLLGVKDTVMLLPGEIRKRTLNEKVKLCSSTLKRCSVSNHIKYLKNK